MIDCLRRRLSFKQRDRDVVVSHGHAIFEFELFSQTQGAFEPLCTLLWIAHNQSEMAHFSKCEWNLHLTGYACGLSLETVSRNERFHETEVEILQGITRRLSHATSAAFQLGPDISEPDGANHP